MINCNKNKCFNTGSQYYQEKKESCVDLAANKVGKCGRKRKTSPITDGKIIQI